MILAPASAAGRFVACALANGLGHSGALKQSHEYPVPHHPGTDICLLVRFGHRRQSGVIFVLTAFALAIDALVGRIEKGLMKWQPHRGGTEKLCSSE